MSDILDIWIALATERARNASRALLHEAARRAWAELENEAQPSAGESIPEQVPSRRKTPRAHARDGRPS
jgi:hypothetical protein